MARAPEEAFGTRPWSWLSRCSSHNAGEAVASPAPRTPLSKAGRRGAHVGGSSDPAERGVLLRLPRVPAGSRTGEMFLGVLVSKQFAQEAAWG